MVFDLIKKNLIYIVSVAVSNSYTLVAFTKRTLLPSSEVI